MGEEKRLLSLLYDAQIFLADCGAPSTFWMKSPENLRRVLRERMAKERLDPFVVGGLTLSSNLLMLQKSVEALKSSWAAELQASEGGLEEFSYSEMLAYPAEGLLAAEKYLQMYDERCLADVITDLGRNTLSRAIIAAQFDAWDAHMEEVHASAVQQSEASMRDSGLADRSLLVRPAGRALDGRRAAYVQAVHRFVLGQRLRERKGDSVLGASQLRSELAPRPDRAFDALLEDLAGAAAGSGAAFVFPIVRELGGSADAAQLAENAARLLEADFFERVRRVAARQPLGRDPPGLPPSQLEPLELLNHYFEGFGLSAELRASIFLERDSDGLALWALCWLGLRAGQTGAVAALLEEYRGSLQADAAGLAELLHAAPGEGGGVFSANAGEDAFKRALAMLLTGEGDLPAAFLLAEMTDYIWFHLRRARRHPGALLQLQQRISALEGLAPLDAAKLDLLCLRPGEAVAELGRAAEAEAAQLAFCLLHCGLLGAERDAAQVAILRFAQEAARKFPTETLAYFEPLPLTALPALADFFEKNDLLGEFFSAASDSRSRAARAEALLGRKWPLLLDALIARHDTRDVVRIRLLEERKDAANLANMMIDEEVAALALAKRGAEPAPEQRECQAMLSRIFEDQGTDRRALGAEKFSQIVLLKQMRALMQLYCSKRKLGECVAFLERNRGFWDVPFDSLDNKVRLAYLELVRLALQVIYESRQAARPASLRSNLGLEPGSAQQLLRLVHDYFYRQVRLQDLVPEEPFENVDAVAKEINKLFTAISLLE